MRFTALLLIILVCGLQAQSQTPKRGTVPLAGMQVLADVDDPFNAQVVSLEAPPPDGNPDKALLREVKKEVVRRFPPRTGPASTPYTAALKTTAAQPPVVSRGFVADSLPSIPPDNDMAISSNGKAVSVVNSTIAVLNDTGKMLNRKSLYTFSLAVGLNTNPGNQNNYRYDPKVMYDAGADRFICVILNGVNQYNYIIVGFSQTNDPAGAWAFYKFYGDYSGDTTWFDYPTVAITDKEFFVSGNKLGFNTSWQTGFRQSVIYQINKASGYSAAPTLQYQIWDSISHNGRAIRNLYPVKQNAASAGPDQWFLSNRNFDVQNDTVFLVRLPDTIGAANQTLTIQPLISNLPYGVPPNGRQRSTFRTLATNDGRILGAFAEGAGIQFVSATNSPGGSSGIYHGRIQNYRTAPSVTATRIAVDSLDFGYPNLSSTAMTPGGQQSIISFNGTGPATFPFLAALYYDGSQHSDILRVKSGDSLIFRLSDTVQRWGDYMGSQPEAGTPGAVWIEGIYGRKDRTYGNWMARLLSPDLVAGTGGSPAVPRVEASLFPNPAFQFIRVRFTAAADGAVRFSITDATGRLVAQVLDARVRKGDSEISLNIASLPPGVYLLQGTDEKGARVVGEQFVRSGD